MILNIIIFFIAIILSFGMLNYKAWQLKTILATDTNANNLREIRIPFRKIEKTFLYFAKHIIQNILIALAKFWFTVTIKINKKFNEVWPKIHDYLLKKKITSRGKNQFIKRAVIESKMKIRYIKEKIKRENSLD